MSSADATRRGLCAAVSFVLPLGLYLATRSTAVPFDDAAELLLCAREWSSAHPPGYPVWVALAHGWGAVFGAHAASLAALSAWLGAVASLLTFCAAARWLRSGVFGDVAPARADLAAAATACLAAVGATQWQWSNAVEVYSLQVLATAAVFCGVALEPAGRWARALVGVGAGVGLANNHLAMVLLVPFVPLLSARLHGVPLAAACRRLVPAAVVAVALVVTAYTLLVVRAHADVRFSFGEPSTWGRLWHHLRGGFFGELMLAPGVDYGGRAAVLGEVLVRHLWLGWAFVGLGARRAWPAQRGLVAVLLGFAALTWAVQLSRAHVPNMDAAALPLLLAFAPLCAAGLACLRSPHLLGVAVLAVAFSIAVNWRAADRRDYPGAEALLAAADACLPPNALLLATSWELQAGVAFAQDERGWRPDVWCVPGSIKGTNAPLLARRCPELHAAVRAEYDALLTAIAAVNPDYVHTDFFHFTEPAVWQAYRTLLEAVFRTAHAAGRPVLFDKQSMALLLTGKVLRDDQVHPTGMLFSLGELPAPAPFPALEAWLEHPFVAHDLCAYGALFDLLGIAPQVAGYWRRRGRADLAKAAEQAAAVLTAAWQHLGAPAPRRR